MTAVQHRKSQINKAAQLFYVPVVCIYTSKLGKVRFGGTLNIFLSKIISVM